MGIIKLSNWSLIFARRVEVKPEEVIGSVNGPQNW